MIAKRVEDVNIPKRKQKSPNSPTSAEIGCTVETDGLVNVYGNEKNMKIDENHQNGSNEVEEVNLTLKAQKIEFPSTPDNRATSA